MNILTQNVCGLSNSKLQTISNSISPRHDILVLTETHLKRNHSESVIKKLGYQNHTNRIFFDSSPDPHDYKGVLLIVAKRTPFIPHTILYSGTGNHIIIVGSFQNNPHIIAGFHGHSTGNDRESKSVLKSMLDKITNEANQTHDPTISLLGDFNFILDPSDHSNPLYRRKPRTEALLKTFIQTHNLTDVQLDDNNNDPPPHTFKRGITSARLDRIYFSRDHMRNSILKQSHLVPSDHSSLLFNWNWKKSSINLRFPVYLLKSKKFLTKLHNSTRELLITNCDNPHLIESYHQTTPPVPNHLRNATEELKSLRSKQLNFPKLPQSSFIDLSSKYKADKIKLFAE
jgi:exonuclease III